MFPWRVSAILMTLATAVICARLAAAAENWGRAPWLSAGYAVLLGAAVIGGILPSLGSVMSHAWLPFSRNSASCHQ